MVCLFGVGLLPSVLSADVFTEYMKKRSQYTIFETGNPQAKHFDLYDMPSARMDYESQVTALRSEVPRLRSLGMSDKDIADYLSVKRRDIDAEYAEIISTEQKINGLGRVGTPGVKELQAQGKSWGEMIDVYTTIEDKDSWYARSLKGVDWLLSKF